MRNLGKAIFLMVEEKDIFWFNVHQISNREYLVSVWWGSKAEQIS